MLQELFFYFWLDFWEIIRNLYDFRVYSSKRLKKKFDSKGMTSKLSILQEAAILAAEDDREEAYDGIMLAAEEIAQEHGLNSPSRKSKLEKSLELSYSRDDVPSQSVSVAPPVKLPSEFVTTISESKPPLLQKPSIVGVPEEPTLTSVPSEPNSVKDDALALLKSMNVDPLPEPKVEPKLAATVAFEQDLQALLNIAREENLLQTHPQPSNSVKKKPLKDQLAATEAAATALAKQKYFTKVQQNKLKNASLASSLTFQRSSATSGTLSTLPSKLSMLLQTADAKPYGENVRQLYRSNTQEMLLKNMYLVNNQSSRPGSKNKHTLSQSYLQEKQLAKFLSDDKDHDPESSMPNTARSAPTIAPSKSRHEQRTSIRQSVDRLAVPANRSPTALQIKIDPTLKHSTYDDAKESTFRPCIGKKKSAKATRSGHGDDSDGERKEDSRYGFIQRQEAEERNRREELAFKQGRVDYDAKLNKKVCPNCLAKQSYDEVKEKRKLCPNCRVPYVHLLTWGKVSKKFFAKMKTYQEKLLEHKKRIYKEVMIEFTTVERKYFDSKTGKIEMERVERKEKRLSKEDEEEFFQRLKEKMAKHEELLKTLEKEVYDELCPFAPNLSHEILHKKKNVDDEDLVSTSSEEEELDGNAAKHDPVKAFMKRYEDDMEVRRLKMPGKYLPTHKYISKRHHHGDDDEFGDEDDENAAENAIRKQQAAAKEERPPRFRF